MDNSQASNYTQLIKEIEQLTKEAQRLRDQEIHNVINTIQQQISEYNITPSELGFHPEILSPASKKMLERKSYYRNADGQTWSGVGRQPKWLKIALDHGHKKEDF
ncbi:H-NS histone family protein [Edwardsiella anguillarum]|nr:H-NS histone family protein [Edwardsiella anguillarum]